MIECQYCYTQNNPEAPSCQACGGPLVEQQVEEERIMAFSPSKGKFVQVGTIHPGKAAEQYEQEIKAKRNENAYLNLVSFIKNQL